MSRLNHDETKITGYTFMYRGCGYCYPTKEQAWAKAVELQANDQYRYSSFENPTDIVYASVHVDQSKNLVSYELHPEPSS